MYINNNNNNHSNNNNDNNNDANNNDNNNNNNNMSQGRRISVGTPGHHLPERGESGGRKRLFTEAFFKWGFGYKFTSYTFRKINT